MNFVHMVMNVCLVISGQTAALQELANKGTSFLPLCVVFCVHVTICLNRKYRK